MTRPKFKPRVLVGDLAGYRVVAQLDLGVMVASCRNYGSSLSIRLEFKWSERIRIGGCRMI